MNRIVVYGVGRYLKANFCFLPEDSEIIAYSDKDRTKVTSETGKKFNGKVVLSPDEVLNEHYDFLYISTSMSIEDSIYEELVQKGIPKEKIRFLSRLRSCPNWKNYCDDGIMVSEIGGVRIRETDANDRGVIKEIFARRLYEIDIKPNTIVIDFGMNVGAASLFFASKENVEKVYGFEPFPDTYEKARKNIDLSESSIAKKIETFNQAVSNFGGGQRNTCIDGVFWRPYHRIGLS